MVPLCSVHEKTETQPKNNKPPIISGKLCDRLPSADVAQEIKVNCRGNHGVLAVILVSLSIYRCVLVFSFYNIKSAEAYKISNLWGFGLFSPIWNELY